MPTIKFNGRTEETSKVLEQLKKAMEYEKEALIGRTFDRVQLLEATGFPEAIALVRGKKGTAARCKYEDSIKFSNQLTKKLNGEAANLGLSVRFDNSKHNAVTLYKGDGSAQMVAEKVAKKQINTIATGKSRLLSISTAQGISKPMQAKFQKIYKNYTGIEKVTTKFLVDQLS